MYHFTADHPPEPVRLSFRALIPGHIRQYLKDFQLDAIRFMHNFLAKGEFCVYNDESGLGKQAAVAVLLDAACSSKKCLIVVQNDDRYVNGWEFHFSVLTNINVAVIKDEKDSTDSAHNIYIAKWSTLRTIDDLSKFKFDFIILDNRGQMLNNSFCTSMLLKHYERKISILISSVDITSDLKLLHNCLRLGGRLDPQYSSFKTFEEKFKLPDAKELAYKRVDLEEYFCKRERLADYCKNFRLRRYCHQFEKQLPLVKEDRYKINLDLWREKQNATNSESSSIEYVNNHNREDEHIKDTQELFEEYCRQRRKQHLQFQQEEEKRLREREQEMLKNLQAENEVIYNVDDEVALINETPPIVTEKPPVARDNSDEAVLMSPLLVMSDSDADDEPEICHDPNNDIEIVDLASEEREEQEEQNKQSKTNADTEENKQVQENSKKISNNTNKVAKRGYKKRSELDRLDEDIVETLKITETPKRLTRHAKEEVCSAKRLKDRLEEKRAEKVNTKRTNSNERVGKATKESNNNSAASITKAIIKTEPKTPTKSNKAQKTTEEKQKETSKDKPAIENNSTIKELKGTKDNANNTTNPASTKSKTKTTTKQSRETNETSTATTPVTSRKTRTGAIEKEKEGNKTPTKTKDNQKVHIKQERLEETQTNATSSTNTNHTRVVNSEKIRLKRELEITPVGVHNKETRSMQRLTRSAGGSSKYLKKNLALQIDKVNKPKKKANDKEITTKTAANKTKKATEDNKKEPERNTQVSIISHRSSQDFETLQCAQRLSDAGAYDNGLEKSTEFLVPPTPNVIARNSLIPSSLNSSAGFFSETDVIFIPPSPLSVTNNKKRDAVITLSSSENENSTSQSSSMTSRRTRALKPKRNLQNTQSEASKVPSFSELLAQQNTRTSAKSPDLFSNCSDLLPLPCTQPPVESEEPNTPFEGFKIFGSEVKQLQQHYAFSKNNNTNITKANAKKSYREQRSCLDILEKMFEPSNKKSKSTTNETSNSASCSPTKKSKRNANTANKQKSQAPILPSHPIEAIAEARQQQELQKRKRTSTPSTSAGLQEDEIFEITNNGTFGSVMRLHSNGDISPVPQTQKSQNKQHNKITNYLIGNATQNGSSGSQEETATPNSGHSGGYSSNNMEAGTPSKRHQQLAAVQNSNVKKSPKGKCNATQATKLTKWFTKPSELSRQPSQVAKAKLINSKKTPTKQQQQHQVPAVSEEVDLTRSSPPPATTTVDKILSSNVVAVTHRCRLVD
ncbi:protein suppressor of underreplication [Lucilia cuprina]|uniref:protein suppressor of underreplication n=1 Tax=Lucilia cuprina TaxID=7375 RepID=UPI001F050C5B|nr:protein suppressor of underreplication [Lucilia cuprina]